MKKILIVANFCRGLDGTNNSRFIYLAEMLSQTGRYDVELITSDFHHLTKTHIDESNAERYGFGIKLCHEPGYVSHRGIRRLFSHRRWGLNVLEYVKSHANPDIVYCAIPSLTAAHELALYCKRQNIKFVVDVQDLWPEAILMLAKNSVVKFATYPMKKYVDTAYENADAIVAVSETYSKRAKSVNRKGAKTLSVFLGNDGESFHKARLCDSSPKENIFTVGYVGTLSYSYDIPCVIEAINILNGKGCYPEIKFLVMGDGPLKTQFEQLSASCGVQCEFTGMLPYDKMVGRLCKCDVLVNPIAKGSAASIINKVGDYALAGLPVVNTQESKEYRDLIVEFGCGINCKPSDASDVAQAIASLFADRELRDRMGANALRLAHEKFDRRTTYVEIVKLLDDITA